MEPSEYLEVAQVAILAGVSERTIYRQIEAGKLAQRADGNVDLAEIGQWLHEFVTRQAVRAGALPRTVLGRYGHRP